MGRKLRIGFVAYRGNMHCGGQGVYLWFLARELAKLGHQVDVFVGPPYPDPMPFVRSVTQVPNEEFWAKWFMGDRYAFLPRDRPLRIFEPLNLYELCASRAGFLPEPFAFSVRAFAAIAARLRAGVRYDVIHDVQCLGYGILGIRQLGMPVVTTVHHPLTVDRRSSFIRADTFRDAVGTMKFYPIGMQRFVAQRIDALFTSSAVSARQIELDFGLASDRIHMVANGVDTNLYSENPASPRNEDEILCVGRASDPNKGIGTLIGALAKLPRRIRLTLVDNDHPDSSARRRARELGCEDRLEITGRIETDELVALYRRAALVVVPSRYEGFGLPAVEAMACGTPVVACAAGALTEVIGVGGGGILVARDDPSALARGIMELIDQPGRRRELGRAASRRITQAYAWPRVAERTASIYGEIVDTFRATRGRPANTMTSDSAGKSRASRSSVSSVA